MIWHSTGTIWLQDTAKLVLETVGIFYRDSKRYLQLTLIMNGICYALTLQLQAFTALVMIGTFKNLRKQCCDIWQVTIYAYHIVKHNKKTCRLLKVGNLHSSTVVEPTSYFLKYLLIHLGLELHFRFHNHCWVQDTKLCIQSFTKQYRKCAVSYDILCINLRNLQNKNCVNIGSV